MRSYSVTDVETYRRWRTDDEDRIGLDELIERLRHRAEPTIAMRAGTALHAILERACEGDAFSALDFDGFSFQFNLDDSISLAPIREMRGQRMYVVGNELVEIRGKVDAIDGLTVVDHKLTSRFDAETYADSYQWRLYLSIFGAQRFVYNVFVGKEGKGVDDGLTDWEIREFHALPFCRYPELEADVQREVEIFADFAAKFLDVQEVA